MQNARVPKGIVLRPDAAGRQAIRTLWGLLKDAGLPSIASHRKGDYEPHLSLTVADDLEHAVTAMDPAKVLPSATVAFEVLGSFPSGVLLLAAVPDQRLLTAQLHAYEACAGAEVWRFYEPGRWNPHITLGYGYTPTQIGRAAELVLPLLPLTLTGWTAWLEDGSTGESWPLTGIT